MEFEVGGIFYEVNKDEKTVSVISNYYEGELAIPDSVEYNGNEYSVTAIGEWAFNECSGLTSIIIPDSVTKIGYGAFKDCSGLESIIVENGNSEYDSRNNCNAIIETKTNKVILGCKNTIIPDSASAIGKRAFEGCSSLTSIVIPESVTEIGDMAFCGCSGVESIVVDNGNSAYDSRDNCNAIIETKTNKLISGCKNTIIPNSVTALGDGVFCGCSGLTSIVIPDSVTRIGNDAFFNCSNLASVDIPDSVVSIGDCVFASCSGLESIAVVKCNQKYDSRDNCNAIIETKTNKLISGCKNTIIPDTVTEIGYGAFSGCCLRNAVIPNSVTTIGEFAFCGCSSMIIVAIPESVTKIGESAFADCSSLMGVVVPESVTEIEEGAFLGCSSMIRVVIPKSVIKIGNNAFAGCSGLTSVIIPNSVTEIGRFAFDGCCCLTKVVIPKSTIVADSAFWGCGNFEIIREKRKLFDIFRHFSAIKKLCFWK